MSFKTITIALFLTSALFSCKKDQFRNRIHKQFMGQYSFTVVKQRTEDFNPASNYNDTFFANGNISKLNKDKVSIDYTPNTLLPPDSFPSYQRTPETLNLSIFDKKELSYPEFLEEYSQGFFEGSFIDDDSIHVEFGILGADYSFFTKISGKKIE